MKHKFVVLIFALSFLLITAAPLYAVTIQYEAVDLTDTTPGEDLRQYTYWVSDYTFDTDYGFWVWFEYNTIESGQTTAIPLPFTLLFLSSGLLSLHSLRKWMNA